MPIAPDRARAATWQPGDIGPVARAGPAGTAGAGSPQSIMEARLDVVVRARETIRTK